MRDFDNEEEYIEAFKLFDKNLDDLISIDELRDVMSILGQYVWGESPTEEDLMQMIKEADLDFDGYLNFSEFLKKIQNTH
jgi:calmodulin